MLYTLNHTWTKMVDDRTVKVGLSSEKQSVTRRTLKRRPNSFSAPSFTIKPAENVTTGSNRISEEACIAW